MPYLASAAPDITEALPATLSARTATALASRNGFKWDYEVNGVGFMRYLAGDAQYRRTSIPAQKDQFDASDEVGEHTLEGYWIRSQSSCHRGAGIKFYEPGSDEDTKHRFESSQGVDVWTPGTATLLKDTDKPFSVAGGQAIFASNAVSSGVDLLVVNHNGTIKRYDGTTTTSYSMSTSVPSTRVAVAGDNIYWGDPTGIWTSTLSTTSVSALWTQASAEAPIPYWLKARLIATKGASIYELSPAGGVLTSVTPLHTNPTAGWAWTSCTESPDAILAAGNGAGTGAIYRFSLEDSGSGSTPKLGQAYQVAEFPPGEQVYAIRAYLGKFLGIATSRGVRVAVLGDSGQMEYGPLIVETANPVMSLTASESFLVAGVNAGLPDGKSGAVKINLGEQIGNRLQFAYNWDAATSATGAVGSIAYMGNSDRLAMCVSTSGCFLQSATRLVASGWIKSGKTRFATIEPKWFRLIDIGATIPAGTVSVFAIDQTGSSVFLSNMTSATGPMRNIGIPQVQPMEYAQLQVTLNAAGDQLSGPTLNSIQVRALPAPRRMRRIQLPLAIADADRDANGGTTSVSGWTRLLALEEAEDSSAIVLVRDSITGNAFNCVIEQIDFVSTSATSGNVGGKQQAQTSGYANLIARKIA